MIFGKKSIIGLDIGSRVVKMAELKQNGEVITLEKFGIEELYPNGTKVESGKTKREAQLSAIKRIFEKSKFE